MLKSKGIIRTSGRYMWLECDKELARYYRWWCRTKGIRLVRQRKDSHVSVIREEESSKGFALPDKYDGMEIEFVYNPEYLNHNATHYWFRILSTELEDIRLELGFCSQPAKMIGDKIITDPFHLTIGRIAHTA